MCLQFKSFENTVGKEVFSFLPIWDLSEIFIKFEIVVYKLFYFGSLKFVTWERINNSEYQLQ